MIIKTPQELHEMQQIGSIVAKCVQHMGESIKVGMTTSELDNIGADFLLRHGARSAPQVMYNFPGTTCISVNEEAAHGIPGKRKICAGDIVNIDVSAERNGFFGDTGYTFLIEPVNAAHKHLIDTTKAALKEAMNIARAGVPINEIGRAIEQVAKKSGYKTLRDLASHGIGRSLHEYPETIPNYYDKRDKRKLENNMVITIEPFLSTRCTSTVTASDGWTLTTRKGNRSAQFEHTMVISKDPPQILTKV
ncbi:type I methionyl aminopeptidase [Pleionea litopenaei]|uniref:Methionine aminopeptidase n=1 Tax=Pleionea litopenaei TaxID=3070815 RepID=A0AA51RVF1_9GAMM|nr:type I methionyl aminopeptidase [Pleionea sp. HL-JVS1]WMS88302.1 type I methionyl aminopeptidase [Pleionea sp. HL-JVS1]